MNIDNLQDMASWARERVISGEEPPWTFEKLQLLNQICAELAASMGATSAKFPVQKPLPVLEYPIQTGNRQEAVRPVAFDAPVKAKIVALDRFRSQRDALQRLPLPM